MLTKIFWKDALERMLSTGAQAVLVVGGATESYVGLIQTKPGVKSWQLLGYAFVAGSFWALMKALAAVSIGSRNSASFIVDAKEVKSTNELKG